MTRILKFSAIAISAVIASAALASDRYFGDLFATSPNGHFRIDAKSPDNSGERPTAFASNFTYTLTDPATKKVLWERKQPMTRSKGSPYAMSAEGSPMRLFINDEGVVLARLAWDTLLILDPADGHKRGEADILKAFPGEELDKFTSLSLSAGGVIWGQASDWFFLTLPTQGKLEAGSYFVIRPFWNHRLIVDTRTGKHVDLGRYHDATSLAVLRDAPEATRRLLAETIEEETRRTTATLNIDPETLKDDPEYRKNAELGTALHTVGFLGLTQAEPRLMELERYFAANDDIPYRPRARVREALRSIGKTPPAGYGVRLYPIFNQDTYHPFNAEVPIEERATNAGKVVAGMTTKELTDLIGCPDVGLYDDGRCYDYDIDAPQAYTLRVYIDREYTKVESVKKITPFAFQHDLPRLRGE